MRSRYWQYERTSSGRVALFGVLFVLFTLAAASSACGNESAPHTPSDADATANAALITGAGTGSQSNVPGSNVFASPAATASAGEAGNECVPPASEVTSGTTGVLKDNLSETEFPRVSAVELESGLRNNPDTVAQSIGRTYRVYGTVTEAGKNSEGVPCAKFRAGAGTVLCKFETITDSELISLSHGGSSSATGKLTKWDPEHRVVTLEGCRLVLGF